MKDKQLTLFLFDNKSKSRGKTARDISLKCWHHVIFKAKAPVLRKHHVLIRQVLMQTQQRYGIRIKAIAIMPDHVHFLISCGPAIREMFYNALKFFASKVALGILHKSGLKTGRLWRDRVWSRVVGQDEISAMCLSIFGIIHLKLK